MKNFNSLFTIGITTILATAIIHIIVTLIFPGKGVNVVLLILYPVSILFLALGFRKILKKQRFDKK